MGHIPGLREMQDSVDVDSIDPTYGNRNGEIHRVRVPSRRAGTEYEYEKKLQFRYPASLHSPNRARVAIADQPLPGYDVQKQLTQK